jgi:hypothetical protein
MQQKDRTQDSRISVVEVDVKENRNSIHRTEMMYGEVNGKLDAIPKIEKRIGELYEYLMTYDFKPKEK